MKRWIGVLTVVAVLFCAAGVAAQEAVIAPGENLVVDGVPKIPAALAETAGRYGSYRSASFADWSEGRSAVYPGITGLWQVNGRSELPFEEMVRLDLQYIREWSLLLDIKIILATPGQAMKGVGAY